MPTAESLAVALLHTAVHRTPGTDPEREPDWGVPVVARLLSEADPAGERTTGHGETARAAVLAWAARHGRGARFPGVHTGGLAGCAVGLAHAARVEPRLRPVAQLAARRVADWGAGFSWDHGPETALTAQHYDLISGVAGITAALASLAPDIPAGVSQVATFTRHLVELCDGDDLERLRIGSDAGIDLARWKVGTINLGLAHGVPGVLAALVAAWPLLADADRAGAAQAIRRIANWLLRHTRRYGEVTGWPFGVGQPTVPVTAGGGHGPSTETERRRQAWCYGTPGVAWQLAEAGRVLADDDIREAGVAAMASLCAAWDDDYHLADATVGERMAFCHGAAGVLAVADAFALHTALEPARRLADHLAGLVTANLPHVEDLARHDLSILSGATGIVAALISRDTRRRGWLTALGLR